MKKSQLSIFVIIGLIIVIVIGTLLLLKAEQKQTVFDLEKIKAGQGEIDQKFLDAYVEHCVELTTIEAQKRYGLDKKASIGPISLYVSAQLPVCLEEFEIFKKQNFNVEYEQPDVNAIITNNALVVDVIFPIKLTKQMLTLKFDKTSYTFPRTVTEEINPTTTTTIHSADRSFVIEIPPGTKAYLNGEEVTEVGLKQLDRNFNGLSNSVVAGMMAFNGIPHGVEFSQPVKITKYYEDYDIPPFINENNLKVGYYHSTADFWVGLPTEVDPVNNKLTIYTTHFSAYGTVLNCGATKDPVTYIYTPTMVKQICDNKEGGCDGWLEDTPEGYGELYKKADTIELDSLEEDGNFNAIKREEWKDIVYCDNEGVNTNGIQKVNDLGSCSCTNAPDCIKQELYDGSYDDEYFGTITCEKPDETTLTPEQMFVEFETEGIKVSDITDWSCDSGTVDVDCKFEEGFSQKNLTDTSLTDKKIVIVKSGCNENNCDGLCVEVGKKDDKKVSVCYADYFSYKYAISTADADSTNDEWGLKGREYYVLDFEKSGNTCIASTGVESTSTVDDALTVGDSTVVTPDSDTRISQTITLTFEEDKINYVEEGDPDSLTMVISPKCNVDDICSIRNAIVKPDESQIWFTLEVENSDDDGEGEPDACIKGSAEIHFKGTGFSGNYSLLCDENLAMQTTPPGIDYINGKCMQCKAVTVDHDGSTETIYRWEERSDATECLFFADGYCAASAIGRIYPDTTEGSTGCIECLPGDSPYYGVANKIASCSCITGPVAADGTAEITPPAVVDESLEVTE